MAKGFETRAPRAEVIQDPVEVRVEGQAVGWTPEDVRTFLADSFPGQWVDQASLRRCTLSEALPADPHEPSGVVRARSTVDTLTGERSLHIALPLDERGSTRTLSVEDVYRILVHELADVWGSQNKRLPIALRQELRTWGLLVGERRRQTSVQTGVEAQAQARAVYGSFFERCLEAWRHQSSEEAVQATLLAHGFTYPESRYGMILLDRIVRSIEQKPASLGDTQAIQEFAVRANTAIHRLDQAHGERMLLRELEAFPQAWRELTEHALACMSHTKGGTSDRGAAPALLVEGYQSGLSADEERMCQEWLTLMSHAYEPERMAREARAFAKRAHGILDDEHVRTAAERAFDAWYGVESPHDDDYVSSV